MTDDELITLILDEAFYVHKKIGPGMLEKVYQKCLCHRLRSRGITVEMEKEVPVVFEDIQMDCGYRTDLVVEQRIVIETKNIEAITDIHVAQTLTYLRFLNLKRGLILNFNTVLLKNGIKRVVNGFDKS